jgi:hypothetical protein
VRLLDHVINPARPIEQAVLGVQVKMDKVRMFHALAADTLGARPNAIKSYRPRNEPRVPAIDRTKQY